MAFLTSGGSQISSSNITDGSILNEDVNAAAGIDHSKLANVAKSGDNTDITSLSFLKTLTVAISSAELKALNATPKILIPAPDADQLIVIEDYTAQYIYGTVQYTDGGTLAVQYTNGTSAATQTFSTAEIQAAASRKELGVGADLGTAAQAALLGLAVQLKNTVATEYANGDGTLVYKFRYYIADWDA
jgi:hypothetical protein